MATLMSAIFGCSAVDENATKPILTELSAKYGKAFSISALGNRYDTDTATAYVYADEDPTLLFKARVKTDGTVEFENYSYRLVCRKAEDIVRAAFEEQGLKAECFSAFSVKNYDISLDTGVNDYIEKCRPELLQTAITAAADEKINGALLEKIYKKIYSEIPGTALGFGLYIVTENDYEKLQEKIRHRVEYYDLSDLRFYGAEEPVKACYVTIDDNGLSLTEDEINELLSEVK